MNFYPYYNFPYTSFTQVPKVGGLKSLFGGIKWSSILSGTQKTLNVINQAIPVYYQIKPIWGNLKSFGKIMSAFNEPDNNSHNYQTVNNQNRQNREDKQTEKKEDDGLPTFFIN